MSETLTKRRRYDNGNRFRRESQNIKSYEKPHNSGLSSFESLELIFICLTSIILLKYKYFIHHIISVFDRVEIIVVFGIVEFIVVLI